MNSNLVSIIIPCRNEEKFIAKTIDSIIGSDYGINNLEILIVDGMSDDGTREIIKRYIKKLPQIKLVDNPRRTVPYAMNYGINQAKGNIIIRMDSHSIYPSNYIPELVYWLKKLNADNVGASLETMTASNSLKNRAIAYAMSHPFGVGNSQFRVTGKNVPYEVDTVPFGCYKRDIFERIGFFDTDLTRNQDDEFNARIIQNGGKIYLIPSLKIKYYARESFSKLAKMFFQYGYFKPLVNIKLKKPATLRQFAPPLLVLFLILSIFSFFLMPYIFPFFAIILALYLGIMFYVSCKLSYRYNVKLFPYVIYSFLTIHISYGLGYLKGLLDFVLLKKHYKKNLNRIDISR